MRELAVGVALGFVKLAWGVEGTLIEFSRLLKGSKGRQELLFQAQGCYMMDGCSIGCIKVDSRVDALELDLNL